MVALDHADTVVRVKRFGFVRDETGTGAIFVIHGLEYRLNMSDRGARVSVELDMIFRQHGFASLKTFKVWLAEQPVMVKHNPHKLVESDLGRKLFDLAGRYDENRLEIFLDD